MNQVEKAFSLFFYVDHGVCSRIGYKVYLITDNQKNTIMSMYNNIQRDAVDCTKTNLTPAISEPHIRSLMYGNISQLFEGVFAKEKAIANPLVIITPVVNGKVTFHIQRFEESQCPPYLQQYYDNANHSF